MFGKHLRKLRRYFCGPVDSLRYYIEGMDGDGFRSEEGTRGPWFVFDEATQKWVGGPFFFRFRAIAECRRLHEAGDGREF